MTACGKAVRAHSFSFKTVFDRCRFAAASLTANARRSDEAYAPGRNGGAAALFYGGNRIVVDAFRNMQFGSQFSVSLFFKRNGGERNYQGIVSNGYGSNGAW